MTIYFLTVYDKNYAARGLVMLDSLRRASRQPIKTVVLALDEDAHRVTAGHADEILRVEDLADSEFLSARSTRTHEEFCWTCAPVLSHFMLQRTAPGDFVAYLDADLYFFTDPNVLIAEMSRDKNILIHPHRFSPDRAAWEATAGTFNVGFVGFRVSEEAMACTRRWRQQVLDLCVKDPDKGLCGDQGYLNEWPALYPGLRIMQNIGGGTAPWNVNAYRVSGTIARPTVDGQPIVFFHYHQLRIIDCGRIRFFGTMHAIGYDFPADVGRYIYDDYVRKLRRQTFELALSAIPVQSNLVFGIAEFCDRVASGNVSPVNGLLHPLAAIISTLHLGFRRVAVAGRRRLKRMMPSG
jgi:hypothetical protein